MNYSNIINKITIESPGRICLFGDHQDYLGLPVIACAINRKVVLTAEINNEEFFNILMPDISSEKRIPIFKTFKTIKPLDYFASALRVVKRYDCIPSTGYTILLKSDIPINAGISSSSAIVVAWVHFLLKAFGCNQNITSQFIAQLAYETEVLEHKSPGGKMDQYTIGIGNIIYIDTAQDLVFKTIGTSMEGLILAESGIPKETLGLLSHLRAKATKAIDCVSKKIQDFNLKTVTMNDHQRFSEYVPEDLRPYFYATIKNHCITQKALTLFEEESIDIETLGKLMSEHHNILKDVLKITVPKIDKMIDAALNTGAYGAKIVGSGGGGSIIALSPPNKKEAIINAILDSGAKAAYEVIVSQGSNSK